MSQSNNIEKLILFSAKKALELQKDKGEFEPDHNGPWGDRVTPVRVTSHWSILLMSAYKETGESVYRDCAQKALEYICDPIHRPGGAIFKCRYGDVKSKSNGLVGQAWVCEALIEAYMMFKEERFIQIALNNINAHKFDESLKLWVEADLNSNAVRVNRTLNQQIFFSAVASKVSELSNDNYTNSKCERFWSEVIGYTRWMEVGLPHHKLNISKAGFGISITRIRQLMDITSWREQSIGYVSFVLYGLVVARLYAPTSPFFESDVTKEFVKSIFYFLSEKYPFFCGASPNSFAWAYNPTGIEVELAQTVFSDYLGECNPDHDWLGLQLKYHMDDDQTLGKNTCDPNVLRSRMYEITRFLV